MRTGQRECCKEYLQSEYSLSEWDSFADDQLFFFNSKPNNDLPIA